MARWRRFLYLALLCGVDIAVSVSLLAYARDRSAFGSEASFDTALAVLGLALLSAATYGHWGPMTRAASAAHVVVGVAVIGILGFTGLIVCADPGGGCYWEYEPFWPALIPGLILCVNGFVALAFLPTTVGRPLPQGP